VGAWGEASSLTPKFKTMYKTLNLVQNTMIHDLKPFLPTGKEIDLSAHVHLYWILVKSL